MPIEIQKMASDLIFKEFSFHINQCQFRFDTLAKGLGFSDEKNVSKINNINGFILFNILQAFISSPTHVCKYWLIEASILCHFVYRMISQIFPSLDSSLNDQLSLSMSYLVVNGFADYARAAFIAMFEDTSLMEFEVLSDSKLSSFKVLLAFLSLLISKVVSNTSNKKSDESCIINEQIFILFLPENFLAVVYWLHQQCQLLPSNTLIFVTN